MIRFLFLLIIPLFFFSCKKRVTDFMLVGKLQDKTYNKGLANARIDIFQTSVGSAQTKLIETIYTDTEGNYEVKIPRTQFVSLKLSIHKDGYFEDERTVNFSELSVKNENRFDFDVYGLSWVKIRLYHQDSQDTKFDIVKSIGKKNCQACCPDTYQQFVGKVDTFLICPNNANSLYEVTYFKLYTSFSGTKSVVTSHMDTSLIELNY